MIGVPCVFTTVPCAVEVIGKITIDEGSDVFTFIRVCHWAFELIGFGDKTIDGVHFSCERRVEFLTIFIDGEIHLTCFNEVSSFGNEQLKFHVALGLSDECSEFVYLFAGQCASVP